MVSPETGALTGRVKSTAERARARANDGASALTCGRVSAVTFLKTLSPAKRRVCLCEAPESRLFAYFRPSRFSIASQMRSSSMTWSKRLISCRPVGEVTLISVK